MSDSLSNPKLFTQTVPFSQSQLDILFDIFDKIMFQSDLLSETEKDQLDTILETSFNQVEQLEPENYIENFFA